MSMDLINRLKEFKKPIEANVVASLWSKSELFHDYGLKVEDFGNEEWKMFYTIGKTLVGQGKQVLDEITVGLFVEGKPKLKEVYEKHGGYETIQEGIGYINIENLDGYIGDLHRHNTIIKLIERGFNVESNLAKLLKMNTDEIYSFYEAQFNDIFVNSTSMEVKSYNLLDNLHELIDDMDKGEEVGLELNNSKHLSNIVNGMSTGHMNLVAATSGSGKSFLSNYWILPSIIKHNEKLLVVINEEDERKWRKEMLLYVANNIMGGSLEKVRFRQGNFTQEEMDLLRASANWLEEKKNSKNIIIVPLQSYNVDTVIKLIKKYSALGVKYVLLDTFKPSYTNMSETMWQSLMMDSVKLYDTIKSSGKNVHLTLTMQLNKASTRMRYLTMDNLSNSKSVIDVMSTCLMVRHVHEEEKENGKSELTVKRKMGGKDVTIKLSQDKQYILIFVEKNRAGMSRQYQLVCEVDFGKCKYKEVGYTVVPFE